MAANTDSSTDDGGTYRGGSDAGRAHGSASVRDRVVRKSEE